MESRSALGRGLRSLIPDKKEAGKGQQRIIELSLAMIVPNENQPRSVFDASELSQLAASIKEKGILQPIIVCKQGDSYEIIAGERRFRACKQLGLMTIPAIVREVSSEESSELALIENIQRTDLNAMERAVAYKRYIDEFDMTQEKLSKKIGMNRSSIANTLRLLTLPEAIQENIYANHITFGHAKVLLSLSSEDEQIEMMHTIMEHRLSVRAIEAVIKEKQGEPLSLPQKEALENTEMTKASSKVDPHVQALRDRLQGTLGTKVSVQYNEKAQKGSISIEYYSLDDLQRILEVIEK